MQSVKLNITEVTKFVLLNGVIDYPLSTLTLLRADCLQVKEYTIGFFCGKSSDKIRGGNKFFIETCMFTAFSRTDLFFFSPSLLAKKHTPHLSKKLPAVTHVLSFQTACKVTSRRCDFADNFP